MNINIHTIPAFHDNYFWLFHQPGSRDATIVDPGDSTPVLSTLKEHGLTLTSILVTHQHPDHIGGVADLLNHYPNCVVYGPADIGVISEPVREGDKVQAAGCTFDVLAVPGHTLNHLAYLTLDGDTPKLFCGDTLFAGGCGRLFEGTPEQMYQSLTRIMQLPDDTLVYCAHEYTEANLRFAQAVEPGNLPLANRVKAVQQLRAKLQPTVPTNLTLEKQTNPFLRASEPTVRDAAATHAATAMNNDIDVFTTIRRWKDTF